MRLAQALADVASVVLLQAGEALDGDALTSRLQAALDARVLVEQAKGVLAQVGGMPVEVAFGALREHGRRHGRPLAETARDLVHREVSAAGLLREVDRPAGA